jgi:hypothetical protein
MQGFHLWAGTECQRLGLQVHHLAPATIEQVSALRLEARFSIEIRDQNAFCVKLFIFFNTQVKQINLCNSGLGVICRV